MKLNIEKIRNFYEKVPSVWPQDDKWHSYSKQQIHSYIQKQKFKQNSYILNAGSGGSDYRIPNDMQHVDVAKNKIDHLTNYIVASIESLPCSNETFTDAICVGSVINYCDAVAAIHELSRVIIPGGSLILEFESSWGFEHIKSPAYKKPAEIVSLPYFEQQHQQWLYSYNYIKKILESAGFKIVNEYRFHYLSGLSFSKYQDDEKAAPLTKFDHLLRYIPIIQKHSNNIVLKCKKL